MSTVRFFITAILMLALTPSFAQTADSNGQSIAKTPLIHWQTDQGSSVYWVQRTDLPIVDILISVDAGALRDRAQHGLAKLTSLLLLTGSGERSETDIINQFEALGDDASAGAGLDYATIHLRTLSDTKHFEPSIQLLTAVLDNPNFSENIFQRERNLLLGDLETQQQNPSTVAILKFADLLYGKQTYAYPDLGTKTGLKELNRHDVIQFFNRYYVPKNMIISIVGDVSRQQAQSIAKRLSDSFPTGPKAPPIHRFKQQAKGKTVHQSFPSTQTTVFYGQLGTTAKDPDHLALIIGNQILGGGSLSSRLYNQVRDKHGLAYAVGSGFSDLTAGGTFKIFALTGDAKAKASVKIIKQTLSAYLKDGPTDLEFSDAKRNILGGFSIALSSNTGILSAVDHISRNHLPDDYLVSYPKRMEVLSKADVTQAMRKHLNPDDFILVMVGGRVFK